MNELKSARLTERRRRRRSRRVVQVQNVSIFLSIQLIRMNFKKANLNIKKRA